MLSDGVARRLEELVTGGDAGLESGAELSVRSADGAELFRAPLARHWRLEQDEDCIWIRPVLGGYDVPDHEPGEPQHRYSLNAARRRGLRYQSATVDSTGVVFELADGETAVIHPVREDLRPELDRWDDFVLSVLPASIEADLDRLVDDSWHGEFA